MKLHARVGDYEGDVDIRIQGTRVFAALDDRTYEIDLQRSGGDALLLMTGGRVFDCRLTDPSNRACRSMFRSARRVIPLRSLIRADCGVPSLPARSRVELPGSRRHARKVVRVLVAAGAEVEAGDGIVVVEAMKMQNEMKAPRAGKVLTVNVEVGTTVNGGDVLAVIE
jgi:hypothetical protein